LAENAYEGLFILDSNQYARNPSGVSEQIPELIKQFGGRVLVSRLWEERRLAYPIGSHKKGTYWLTYFQLESTQLDPLTRQCHLNENIVRQLFVRLDPRIVDTLVQHALVGPAEKPKPAPTPTAKPIIVEEVVVDALADVEEE
jgi:small subunit ribosomal protein S6